METKLFIKDLEIYAYHGLFSEENKLGQKFVFSLECTVDYTKALISDVMTDSISYAGIADKVVEVATNDTYNLLEKLAGEVIRNLFISFQTLESVKLTINKPNAPVKYSFSECGVVVEMTREEYNNLFYENFSTRN